MDIIAKVPVDKVSNMLKQRDVRNLEASLRMLAQLDEILSTGLRSCADRIVSIFQC